MLRVLSVIHYPFFGGPHNQVLRLSAPLAERGFSTLAVLPDEAGNAFDRLMEGGVEVVRMPLGRVRARLDVRTQLASVRTIGGDVPRLTRLIREREIDLVVVLGLANPQGAVAARLCRRPVVWQVLDTRLPRTLRATFTPAVRVLASSVMTTGEIVARAHPGLPRSPDKLFPFFPPVVTSRFAPDERSRRATRDQLGVTQSETLVGCVANLTPQKGLIEFIDVARRVMGVDPAVRFAIFGSRMATHEDYADRVLAEGADLIQSGRLMVVDVGAAVVQHLRTLDVFLATAVPLSEGISTTILEAMAVGVPVVTTDVGGIREAVQHRVSGFLVDPANPAELARRIGELVRHPTLRDQMASASRARAVKYFDVETCADVHERAFRSALGDRAG